MRNPGLFRHSVVAASAAVLLATPLIAATKIEPQPADVLPRVRGKLPAEHARVLDVTTAGPSLVAVGEFGNILVSSDGDNWEQVPAPHRAMLIDVEFADANNGWAVGHDNTIMRTNDGGKSWKIQHFNADKSNPFFDLELVDGQKAIAVGDGGRILRTTDGGKNWKEVETFILDLGMHANSISRLNDGTLAVVGERSMMARSTDDGETWEMVFSPYNGTWFGVLPYGEKGALFYGLRGNVYATEDYSAIGTLDPDDWDQFEVETLTDSEAVAEAGFRHIKTDTTNSFLGGTQLSDGSYILVGVNGVIFRSDANVTRFNEVNNPTGTTLGSAVEFNGKLVVVGQTGIQVLDI